MAVLLSLTLGLLSSNLERDMSLNTLLKHRGMHVHKIILETGDLDVETGESRITFRSERIRAVVGPKNYGFQMHMQLNENMIILDSQADLIVIGDSAYITKLVAAVKGVYIHKLDKVKGNEYQSIVDSLPAESSDSVFLI